VTRFNKAVANKVLIHLAGHGPFVELEHVGRRSGKVYRIPLMAFRHGEAVTLALTYGRKVDWYRNVVAAGGCRIRMGRELLTLGAPRRISPDEGLARMPAFARPILRANGVQDFVELPVLAARPVS
jgi:deazaflavin-dependent oxidoreductase (nitroreductase family)